MSGKELALCFLCGAAGILGVSVEELIDEEE